MAGGKKRVLILCAGSRGRSLCGHNSESAGATALCSFDLSRRPPPTSRFLTLSEPSVTCAQTHGTNPAAFNRHPLCFLLVFILFAVFCFVLSFFSIFRLVWFCFVSLPRWFCLPSSSSGPEGEGLQDTFATRLLDWSQRMCMSLMWWDSDRDRANGN